MTLSRIGLAVAARSCPAITAHGETGRSPVHRTLTVRHRGSGVRAARATSGRGFPRLTVNVSLPAARAASSSRGRCALSRPVASRGGAPAAATKPGGVTRHARDARTMTS